MLKSELLKAVANKIEGNTQKEVSAVLEAFEEVVNETLRADKTETISLGKLGKFKVKEVPERRGKIMMGARAGEEYVTPAHSEITFKMIKASKNI